ncbi:MAG TPA: bifunctional metallophosphatase/5'-nucleotidase [Archangium sp.]|nr:bifunctional metallophosphatase/5'-nucleotidase [Archangium sp.]
MLHPKKRPVTLAVALLALAFAPGCDEEEVPPPPPAQPEPAFTLQILHASDMESGLPATDVAPRFSAVLRALEEQAPTQTLKLGSGDLWLPGVFYNAGGDAAMRSLLGKESPGRADIAMLNEMGFHAASFGNHEFDSGPREVRNIIAKDGDWSGAKFPYLSANLDFSKSDLSGQVVAPGTVINSNNPGTALHNKVSASVVFDVNGERVGVVGATTPRLPRISSPGTVITSPADSVDFDGLASIIQKRVDELRGTGISKVILMAHMQTSVIELDELPQRLEGVDIIIAGGNHAVWTDSDDTLSVGDARGEESHDYPQWKTSKSGEPVAVLNVASNWRYVGRFQALFDDKGVLMPSLHDVSKNGAYATDEAGVARLSAQGKVDPEVQAIATGVKNVVLAKDGNILGKSQVYLNGLRPSVRTEETNLGNLVTDAYRWTARNVDTTTVLALSNGGGIRDSIGTVGTGSNPTYGPPAANPAANKKEGEISQLDIENSLRFNNPLSLVTVTASQLEEVLENGVASVATAAGQFPQVSGLRFEYDPSRQAQVLDPTSRAVVTVGQRIRHAVIVNDDGVGVDTLVEGGALVGDPNRTFRMVTLSFLAGGGDNYPFKRFQTENPTRFNLVSLTTHPDDVSFTAVGREQRALADYLTAKFPASGPGYAGADTATSADTRIKPVTP